MNLKHFDTVTAANEGRRCDLLDPAGKPTDAFLLIAGADSDVCRQWEAEAADRRYKMSQEGKEALTAAELLEEDLERLVVCTLGWGNLEDEDGTPLPVTPANARRIYRLPAIRDQAEKFRRDRARFLVPSKPD